jgi:hypothetical protein
VARIETESASGGLGPEAARQRDRLVELRHQLQDERTSAVSPAVERALEMADMHLFLGLLYLGYTGELFPEE